jgi:tetratricopeptide (TPR) repeat protein
MSRASRSAAMLGAVLVMTSALPGALDGQQISTMQGAGVLAGVIRDSQKRPVNGAVVTLRSKTNAQPRVSRTGPDGLYSFSGLTEGSYSIHAEKGGVGDANAGPFEVVAKETKTLDLTLTIQKAAFFDEPTFTVAGVTDSTYLGGHGSEAGMRSTESLARATAKLGKNQGSSSTAALEGALRDAVQTKPDDFEANLKLGEFLLANGRAQEGLQYLERAAKLDGNRAEVHQLLGDSAEQLGEPLTAVREYQRAVELDANEPNLFDWGAELLVHRAAEPAIEVFMKGNRLYPHSSRMLLGLAAAYYARGDYEQAARRFFEACDLNPSDAGPYLFMAKVQSSEITQLEGFTKRLERFVRLRTDNAWAKYYYATNIWSIQKEPGEADVAQVKALLEAAIHLDPNLGVAYLQLGIIYWDRKDHTAAIAAFQKAVQVSPELEQAHYRLARAYERVGREEEGRKELDQFEHLSKKSAATATRERSELQQFVFSLQNAAPDAPHQ